MSLNLTWSGNRADLVTEAIEDEDEEGLPALGIEYGDNLPN